MGGGRDFHRGGNGGPGWGGPNGADSGHGDDQDGNAPSKTPGRSCGSILRGIDLADAATFLAITEDELKTELETGTFLDIATSHGKTTDEVRAFLIEQATADIDERLQAAESAPASDSTAEPATGGSSISDATEVPTTPALTPTATATA